MEGCGGLLFGNVVSRNWRIPSACLVKEACIHGWACSVSIQNGGRGIEEQAVVAAAEEGSVAELVE